MKIPKGNQNPLIKGQTTQWPKEKVQKDKQRSTKHTYNTKESAVGFSSEKKSKHNKSDMNNKRRQSLSELTYYRTPLHYYVIHYDGYSGPNYCAHN